MLSAADFLPSYMIEFMNFVMMMFPNFGSGFTSRFSAEWRRDIDQIPDYFGRFAPYFERRCLRFLTHWVSRTPRRMWYRTPGKCGRRRPPIMTTECTEGLRPSPGM